VGQVLDRAADANGIARMLAKSEAGCCRRITSVLASVARSPATSCDWM
jgi:hypothetical protein